MLNNTVSSDPGAPVIANFEGGCLIGVPHEYMYIVYFGGGGILGGDYMSQKTTIFALQVKHLFNNIPWH